MWESLSRGKTLDTGKWIYGDLIHRQIWNVKFCVIRVSDSGFDNYEEYEVFPETVGQFTNVVDKDGKKIFKDDTCWDAHAEEWGVVKFMDGEFTCIFGNVASNLRDTAADYDTDFRGNIHDNPERMDGESDV